MMIEKVLHEHLADALAPTRRARSRNMREVLHEHLADALTPTGVPA